MKTIKIIFRNPMTIVPFLNEVKYELGDNEIEHQVIFTETSNVAFIKLESTGMANLVAKVIQTALSEKVFDFQVNMPSNVVLDWINEISVTIADEPPSDNMLDWIAKISTNTPSLQDD